MEKAPYAKEERVQFYTGKIEYLECKLEELKVALENFELDEEDYQDQFDEILDEQGEIKICGANYYPSTILKEVDPINYRCSLSDFVNSIEIEETEEYKDLEDEISDIEAEISRLNDLLDETIAR